MIQLPEKPMITIIRKQIYDEVWKISVAGMAKKYAMPYTHLLKQIKAVRTAEDELKNIDQGALLAFMEAEELSVAEQLQIPDADARLHAKIISHRKKVVKWQEELKSNEAKGWGKRNMPQAPFLGKRFHVYAVFLMY